MLHGSKPVFDSLRIAARCLAGRANGAPPSSGTDVHSASGVRFICGTCMVHLNLLIQKLSANADAEHCRTLSKSALICAAVYIVMWSIQIVPGAYLMLNPSAAKMPELV